MSETSMESEVHSSILAADAYSNFIIDAYKDIAATKSGVMALLSTIPSVADENCFNETVNIITSTSQEYKEAAEIIVKILRDLRDLNSQSKAAEGYTYMLFTIHTMDSEPQSQQ